MDLDPVEERKLLDSVEEELRAADADFLPLEVAAIEEKLGQTRDLPRYRRRSETAAEFVQVKPLFLVKTEVDRNLSIESCGQILDEVRQHEARRMPSAVFDPVEVDAKDETFAEAENEAELTRQCPIVVRYAALRKQIVEVKVAWVSATEHNCRVLDA